MCVFLLLSSRIICVLCVRRRSRWRRKRRREGEWWESIEFGWQLVASTLRMRNISPQQQWQSVQQWNWRGRGGGSVGENSFWTSLIFMIFKKFFFSCCLHYHKIFIASCLCLSIQLNVFQFLLFFYSFPQANQESTNGNPLSAYTHTQIDSCFSCIFSIWLKPQFGRFFFSWRKIN